MRQDRAGVYRMTRRNGAHGLRRKGDGFGHGKIKPDQPLQAFCAPAMGRRADIGTGGDFGELGDFLHCGTFTLRAQDTPDGAWCKAYSPCFWRALSVLFLCIRKKEGGASAPLGLRPHPLRIFRNR